MPSTFCLHPRCNTRVPRGYCDEHQRQKPSANLYNLQAWKKLRLEHLRLHPLCVKCQAEGRITVATVVHHIIAHRGNLALFLDPANLESLCKPHHDKETGKGR